MAVAFLAGAGEDPVLGSPMRGPFDDLQAQRCEARALRRMTIFLRTVWKKAGYVAANRIMGFPLPLTGPNSFTDSRWLKFHAVRCSSSLANEHLLRGNAAVNPGFRFPQV